MLKRNNILNFRSSFYAHVHNISTNWLTNLISFLCDYFDNFNIHIYRIILIFIIVSSVHTASECVVDPTPCFCDLSSAAKEVGQVVLLTFRNLTNGIFLLVYLFKRQDIHKLRTPRPLLCKPYKVVVYTSGCFLPY